MNISLAFTRTFFVILSIFFVTPYVMSISSETSASSIFLGVSVGALFGGLLVGFDMFFKRFNLRSFNAALVGIFIGYLMGLALSLVFDAILEISMLSNSLQPQTLEMLKIALFLFGTYLGTIMTIRASDEFYVSIPFVKLTPMTQKKKDLLIDVSCLSDSRIIDLCASGLLDHQLIIPRFFLKDLYTASETGDENQKNKAKRALETIKKLEAMGHLEIRFNETDFSDTNEQMAKLLRLARLIDANILSADISRVQMSSIEGVRVINIHALSNALKPLMQAGEVIKIKIQRYGKEPRQGIGYLEDGTMVVVNGGGSFIGEIIDAQVLSVKHTSSGRMIFCNAVDDEAYDHDSLYEEEFQDER